MKILLVKTSSLGDIIQALCVLPLLQNHTIHWAVEKSFEDILKAHPSIHRVIPLETKKWKKIFSNLSLLRRDRYDSIIDLQGNTKSGLVTLLARGREKVGYTFRSAPEWPHALFMTHRYHISHDAPIAEQYLTLVQNHFCLPPKMPTPFSLRIKKNDEQWIQRRCRKKRRPLLMISIGSQWKNKRLPLETWKALLQAIEKKLRPSFFFVWGNEKEKKEAISLCTLFPQLSEVLPKMSLPVWQRLMAEMDGVVSVDSSALHLAATTSTPTFGIFGPSSSKVYKPMGEKHGYFQGACHDHNPFTKRCRSLRSCTKGTCIKEISPEMLTASFFAWWHGLGFN
jgi:heptosyltransferase-1